MSRLLGLWFALVLTAVGCAASTEVAPTPTWTVAHRIAVMDQGRVVESYLLGNTPTHQATTRLLAATPTLR